MDGQESTRIENIPLEGVDVPDGLTSAASVPNLNTSYCHNTTEHNVPRHNVVHFDGTQTYGGRVSHHNNRNEPGLLSNHAHQYGRAQRPNAWQNTVLRRRRQGFTPTCEEETVDEITNAMEADNALMAIDHNGEVLRIDALRELTQSLTMKKVIKHKLSQRSYARSYKKVSYFSAFKYSLSMRWYKMRVSAAATIHDYSLWHKDLKVIEGTFGTGIGSYFRFLRHLFLLNTFIAFVICGFLLVPQLTFGKDSFIVTTSSTLAQTLPTTPVAAARMNTSNVDGNGDIFNGIQEDDDDSMSIGRVKSSTAPTTNDNFRALDWLTGAGWFARTSLYYGSYCAGDITGDGHTNYNMTLAYFFTILFCFLIYLGFLLRSVIEMYKDNYIDTEYDVGSTFVRIVFTAWDFNITNEKAASIKHRSIYNELMEILQEYQEVIVDKSWCSSLVDTAKKTVYWFCLLGLMAALGWLLYFILDNVLGKVNEAMSETESLKYWKDCMLLMIYPVLASLVMLTIPIVLEALVQYEGYKNSRITLYVTLIRTILLELLVVGVLIGFWFFNQSSEGDGEDGTVSTPSTNNVGSTVDSNGLTSTYENMECWESSLGQEIYRLLMVDFIAFIIYSLVYNCSLALTSRKNMESGKLQDFNIARNTLHLVYNQTLVWAGLFFCPLTPLIVIIKLVIIFYIQKISVLRSLRPLERPLRAAQSETVFFALTLLSLILALLSFGYIITKGNCSALCGPFIGYTHYIDKISDLTKDAMLSEIFKWFVKPGVVAAILGVLAIISYCAKSLADGRAEMVCTLRRQLELEIQDRTYLIQLTEKVKKGEHRVGSPRSPTSPSARYNFNDDAPEPSYLSQRGSFVFTSNKVHPKENDDHPNDSAAMY